MANTQDHKRAAVYVREVPAPPVLPSVSPSGLGLVGYTLKGPANVATRVESFDTFRETFGSYTSLSLVPLTLEKYFNNGGQVAYIVRITPVGSVKAENRLLADTFYSQVAVGDGTTTLFSGVIPNAPLAKATLAATINGAGAVGPYTFSLTGPIQPNTVGIIAGAQIAVDSPIGYPTGGFISTAGALFGTINYETGACAITFAAPVALGTSIKVYTTTTQILAVTTAGNNLMAFDDGTGYLVGDVGIGANSIDYLTGEYSVTFTSAPDGQTNIRLVNDAFGIAGNVAMTNGVGAGGFSMTGMLNGTAYLPADGTIVPVAGALLLETDTFGISDGVNPKVTFQFHLSAGSVIPVTPGNIPVLYTAALTVDEVGDAIRAAINGASDLNVTAEPISAYGTRDRWLFQCQFEGVSGNDVLVELEGNDTFRIQERDGEFAVGTLLAVGNGTAGPYSITIPNAPLIVNTLMVSAADKYLYDDGIGGFITEAGSASANSSVNYTSGLASLTFSGVIATGFPIRVHRDGFPYFDLFVSEYQADTTEFLVKETFFALDLVDSESSEYLPTVINDPIQGSSYVTVVTGQSGIPPTLIRQVYTQTLGTGDGTIRRFTGTLSNAPIDPSSVKVTVSSPFQEALDDSVGFLTGPYVDPYGANAINYETGAIDITFKQPPAAVAVKVVYVQQQTLEAVQLIGGTEGSGVLTRSQIADPALETNKEGVYALNRVTDPLNVIVPDFAESALVLNDLITYAEARGNRFIIGTTARNLTPTEAVNYRRRDIRSASSFCAVYYPWLKTNDPSTSRTRTVPPVGHVAGVYARVDRTRSEGKAPAGISDGLLQDVAGVERVLESADLDRVYPVNINPIAYGTAIGLYVDGARTLSTDSNFMFISTRRVFISYRAKAENGLLFALFEPIGPALYARVKAALTSICLEFYQKGALAGTTPREAFIVTVDELNTIDTVNARTVKARVALAPTKPAEFIDVDLTINQQTGVVTVTG